MFLPPNLDINDTRATTYSRTLPFLPPEEPAPLPTQKKSHDRIKLVTIINLLLLLFLFIQTIPDINGKHPLNTSIVPFILTIGRSTRPTEKILYKTSMVQRGCFRHIQSLFCLIKIQTF